MTLLNYLCSYENGIVVMQENAALKNAEVFRSEVT